MFASIPWDDSLFDIVIAETLDGYLSFLSSVISTDVSMS